ncbi:MAG: peptide ABC transporter substrate-binding protein [Anaerolineae bacterium]|nr:peptide ABC transporter substrate-binding protein [Anaerolineae bacterium]
MKERNTVVIVVVVALVAVLCLGAACCAGAWVALREFAGRASSLTGGEATPARAASATAGELRLAEGPPVTLDPALVQDAQSAVYVVEIFGGLVTLDENLEVAPDLADTWEVSEDGRTYTFHLRADARFQSGRPVTAADVEFSLTRACSPELRSSAAASYLNDIEGARAVMQGEASAISGVRVLDERTVALTIDAPKAYFLAKLTYPAAFVVDRENVAEGESWTERPNGTGPFRLVEWTDEKIVLERNASYHRGAPQLARVTFVLSGGDPLTMYENNELDIVQVGLGAIDRVLDPSNPLNRELSIIPRLDVQYLAMNPEVPPFDDVLVRRAFARAIDRERLAEVVLRGMVDPAEGILPPGIPGYRPEFKGLGFDPEQARELLRQSRYGDASNLPEIVLYTSGEGGSLSPTVQAIVAMLNTNLGVEVTVEQTAWNRFLMDLNERRYGFYITGWIADYPDPQNFLDILFHSQSPDNHSAYANPEVDQLLEQARVELDREKRLELYQQAETLIVQDAAWVPLWHGRDYVLTKPYVRGAVYSASIRPWLKDVYIER